MSTSADFRLEQAIYGSRSGDRDYRILAVSPGVARADRDLIEQHANLGGTALTGEQVEPFYSAFPLDPRGGRHAFARAVVLGRGGRGNDYLVHALILSPALLQTLRGDLFLLADAGLFAESKPDGEELPAPDLDLRRWELASRRVCGADVSGEIALENLAPLLAALTLGPLAVQVAEGSLALSLCRALLSTLPPDDRTSFAFCSRFCQPRALPYRFSAFVPEDRPLAERYLRGAVRPLPVAGDGPIAVWLAAARGRVEPVSGLSLLRDPDRAVVQVRLLETLPEPGPRRARARNGASKQATEQVLEIARHPANAGLPRLGGQLLGVLAQGLEQSAAAALLAGDPAALLVECGRTLAQAPAAELIDELRSGGGLPAVTAEISVALSADDTAPLRAIFGPADRDLASWLEELLVQAPGFALPFLALAFSRWRELDGGALSAIMALLAHLPNDVPLNPALAAIERAAPSEAPAERRAWFRSYLKWLLPWLDTRVPAALAARLAGQEGLLEEMPPGELLPLVRELAASFPQLLDRERLAGLPDPALESFLANAARGLRFAFEGGDGWDLERNPERARLAERLASRSAEKLGESVAGGPSPELARGALALVRAAAGRPEVNGAPFRSALMELLRAHPAGLTAPAARAAARLPGRFGPLPSFEPRELAAIRAQACRDARESAPRGAGWPVLIWLEALAPRAAQGGRFA
ncbi:MAG: hypothetical protein ABJC13_09680 [Acidobacteriota bacterium]